MSKRPVRSPPEADYAFGVQQPVGGTVAVSIVSTKGGISFGFSTEQAFELGIALLRASLTTVRARELQVGDRWYHEERLIVVSDVVEEVGRVFVSFETLDGKETHRRVTPSSLVRVIR